MNYILFIRFCVPVELILFDEVQKSWIPFLLISTCTCGKIECHVFQYSVHIFFFASLLPTCRNLGGLFVGQYIHCLLFYFYNVLFVWLNILTFAKICNIFTKFPLCWCFWYHGSLLTQKFWAEFLDYVRKFPIASFIHVDLPIISYRFEMIQTFLSANLVVEFRCHRQFLS